MVKCDRRPAVVADEDRGWFVVGQSLRCHSVSASVQRWFCAERAAFLLWNWRQFIRPEDYDRVRIVANALQRGELPPVQTWQLIAADGRVIVMTARWFWRTYDGLPETIFVQAIRDRRAEHAIETRTAETERAG
jgi:PAS domain-containing protein